MWLLLVGCVEADPAAVGPGPASIRVEPLGIYFGDLPWDEVGVEELTLRNEGDEPHSVELVSSSDKVVLGSSGLTLDPGVEASIDVGWGGNSFERIEATIAVRSDGVATAFVPVFGERTYPSLRTLPQRYVVDDVPVGCTGRVVGRLTNGGTLDAIVSSVELLDSSEFTIDSGGGPIKVPFLLTPGSSVRFRVSYTPNEERESRTAIRIASNDPLTPVLDVEVVGRGVLEKTEPISLSWTIPPPADALTALFEINAEVAGYGVPLVDAFGAFFAALDETKIPYRVAIVQEGLVGPALLPYIDDSLASDVALDLASTMLGNLSGDEDASLEHLLWGIDRNRAWLFDEGEPEWGASLLHLVVMNVDVEQSPEDAAYYVERYREYKDDPSLIRVHGIAGPPPVGCSGGDGASFASGSVNLLTAVELTDGSFRSICDDWTANLDSLAFAMQGTLFRLEGVPVVSTIEVAIDGVAVTTGWSYDSSTNEIMFDDATYPGVGSTVDVTYLAAMECR